MELLKRFFRAEEESQQPERSRSEMLRLQIDQLEHRKEHIMMWVGQGEGTADDKILLNQLDTQLAELRIKLGQQ